MALINGITILKKREYDDSRFYDLLTDELHPISGPTNGANQLYSSPQKTRSATVNSRTIAGYEKTVVQPPAWVNGGAVSNISNSRVCRTIENHFLNNSTDCLAVSPYAESLLSDTETRSNSSVYSFSKDDREYYSNDELSAEALKKRLRLSTRQVFEEWGDDHQFDTIRRSSNKQARHFDPLPLEGQKNSAGCLEDRVDRGTSRKLMRRSGEETPPASRNMENKRGSKGLYMEDPDDGGDDRQEVRHWRRHRHAQNSSECRTSSSNGKRSGHQTRQDNVIDTLVQLLLGVDGFQFMGEGPSSADHHRFVSSKGMEEESGEGDYDRNREKRSPSQSCRSDSDNEIRTCPCRRMRRRSLSKRYSTLQRSHEDHLTDVSLSRPILYTVTQSSATINPWMQKASVMLSPRTVKCDSRLGREVIFLRKRVKKLQKEIKRLKRCEAMAEAALDKILAVLGHITKEGNSPAVFASFADKFSELRALPLAGKQLAVQLLNGLATVDSVLRRRVKGRDGGDERGAERYSSNHRPEKQVANTLGERLNHSPLDKKEFPDDLEMHSNMALSHSRVASIDRRDNASRKSGRPKALTWKEPHRKFVEHDSNTDEASNVPKRQSNRWGLSDAAEHHRVIPSTASVNASLSSSCRRLFENLQEGESQMSSCSSDAEPCRSSLAISLSSASLSSEELVKTDRDIRQTLAVPSNGRISTPSLKSRHIERSVVTADKSLESGQETDKESVLNTRPQPSLVLNTRPESSVSFNNHSQSQDNVALVSDQKLLHPETVRNALPNINKVPLSSSFSEITDDGESAQMPSTPTAPPTDLKSRPKIVPPLGLRGVGSGSWMSGQQTSGETYASYGPGGRSAASTVLPVEGRRTTYSVTHPNPITAPITATMEAT